MPTVGDREFPYTKEGRKQAAIYAAKTGQEVKESIPGMYQEGGEVRDRFGFGVTQGEAEPTQQMEFTKESVGELINAAKSIISEGEVLPSELEDMIMNIPANSENFDLTEELSNEINTIKAYISETSVQGMQKGGKVKRYGY